MKFVLLVEGRTERDSIGAFLKRWLDPQLRHPVGMNVVSFDGHADLIQKMATRARMHLEGPRRTEIIAVVGLMDLYGPTFYPPDRSTPEERFAWGKEHFEREVGLEKFRFCFAVHEFEAWLLSQPDIFPRSIRDALLGKVAQPERVNFDEPHDQLLDRVYKQQTRRSYKKTTYGKQLFAKLDPTVALNACPRLKDLLLEMRSLANAEGL